MNPYDIETLAMDGGNMPEELSTAEQLLFQKLRCLYVTHRLGRVSLEQGRREKTMILNQFKSDQLAEQIYHQHLRIYNRTGTMLSDAEKSDCERCKRFARILDGRETL